MHQDIGLSEELTTGIINRYLKLYAVQDEEPVFKKFVEKDNDRRHMYGTNWGDLSRVMLWGKITGYTWSEDLINELRADEKRKIEARMKNRHEENKYFNKNEGK